MRTHNRRRLLSAVVMLVAGLATLGATVAIFAAPSHPHVSASQTPTSPVKSGLRPIDSANTGLQDMACSPTASQTMKNTASYRCGFADTTNTGVPADTSLVDVPGAITSPLADGSTGQGWSWNGSWITVAAGGVLKNVRV